LSNNEDDPIYTDTSRLWHFKIIYEEKGKKPGKNDIKRVLKLTEDFEIKWNNNDEEFFV